MKHQNDCPLSWPAGQPRTKNPQGSRFRNVDGHLPGPGKARKAILFELGMLGADRVSISTNLAVRRDGEWNESKQVIFDRGAAVYWNLGDQRKVLACDKWATVGENLWAIAKTIEATRGIERWGSVTTEQAFAGYTALVEKTQASCWEILGIGFFPTEGSLEHREKVIMDAWRREVKKVHPDYAEAAPDYEAFERVNAAKDMALQLIKQ